MRHKILLPNNYLHLILQMLKYRDQILNIKIRFNHKTKFNKNQFIKLSDHLQWNNLLFNHLLKFLSLNLN